jgi:hypothetical protein
MLVCSGMVPVDKGSEYHFMHTSNNVVRGMSVLCQKVAKCNNRCNAMSCFFFSVRAVLVN